MKLLRARFRCWLRGHEWRGIITYTSGHDGRRKEKQRCIRCGHYRTAVMSYHDQVKEQS
jgi:hypothetical protein